MITVQLPCPTLHVASLSEHVILTYKDTIKTASDASLRKTVLKQIIVQIIKVYMLPICYKHLFNLYIIHSQHCKYIYFLWNENNLCILCWLSSLGTLATCPRSLYKWFYFRIYWLSATWWRSFQKRVVRPKLCIHICNSYVFYCKDCEFESRWWRGVLDTRLYDKVCQWLATGR